MNNGRRLVLSMLQEAAFNCYSLIEKYRLYENNFFDRLLVSAYFAYKRFFERGLILWLRKNPQILKNSLDVGAGFGFYSYVISKVTNSQASVIAFEPDPLNFSRVLKVCKRFRLTNVTAINCAITSHKTKLSLVRDVRNPANHQTSFEDKSNTFVNGISLDSFCVQNSFIPTFLKIDVQGHEFFALKGADLTLRTSKPVLLVEFDFGQTDVRHQEVWALLLGFGYRPHFVQKSGTLQPISGLPNSDGYIDLIFLPPQA